MQILDYKCAGCRFQITDFKCADEKLSEYLTDYWHHLNSKSAHL